MLDGVAVQNLVKRYGRNATPAIDDLSFSVAHGEVFGLLGPNGAGKTTTIGILTTRVRPTRGTVLVDGVDVVAHPKAAREKLAVVPQRINLDRSLNIRQNLLFHAAYHGFGRAERKRQADEILERMGLTGHATAKVEKLSHGQVQRVMIARALMHAPRVLFLDEPTTGLDPQARLFVHERIFELRSDNVTVVLTTHDMDDASRLCDRVGIVDHGKLLALGKPSALTGSLPGTSTITVTAHLNKVTPGWVRSQLDGIRSVQRVEQLEAVEQEHASVRGVPAPRAPVSQAQFRLYTETEPATLLPAVLGVLGDMRGDVTDLSIGTPSLEDVFIHLTGRDLR